MKLAQLIALRKETVQRLEAISESLGDNAVVEEGKKALEDPMILMKECDRLTLLHEEIICAINMANMHNVVDGETLTQMMARREAWANRISVLSALRSEASSTNTRANKSEILFKSAVDVKALQKYLDKLARDLRVLDAKMQEAIWQIEVGFKEVELGEDEE